MNNPKQTTRIIDINGDMINPPESYYKAIGALIKFISEMEADNVDRSDMYVMLENVHDEATFHLKFLKPRSSKQ